MTNYKDLFLFFSILHLAVNSVDSTSYRSYFDRLLNRKLLSGRNASWEHVTVETCASWCLEYDGFECKSFDYVNEERRCLLYPDSDGDPAERLVPSTHYSHYVIVPDQKVSIVANKRLMVHNAEYRSHGVNASDDVACLFLCLKEVEFRCRSYDLDVSNQSCILHSASMRQFSSRLTQQNGTDHYRTAYLRKFRQLPHHSINEAPAATFTEIWTAEQCARRCYLETKFRCRSFVHKENGNLCLLSRTSSLYSNKTQTNYRSNDGLLVREKRKVYYYERTPEGPLAEFINYGIGLLDYQDSQTYRLRFRDVNLQTCAQHCLTSQTITCRSFDWDPATRLCLMTDVAAYTLQGIYRPADDEQMTFMHFEKIDRWLRYYDVTPYALILGENRVEHKRVTPNKCARLCLEETAFVCRSFEYLLSDSTCTLSERTPTDVGGLTLTSMSQLHHFQMKPILDCGGRFTALDGNFASPNWPRHYDHHQDCTWQIFGQKFKVIKLKFTHIDLYQDGDHCTNNTDSLYVRQVNHDVTMAETCLSDQSVYSLETDDDYINVTMETNALMAANGFRAFYVIDWPCENAVYTENHGQLASPFYPKHYPSSQYCTYQITAPVGFQIALTLTNFHVGRTNRKCTDRRDRVKIHDGPKPTNHVIGLLCGVIPQSRTIYSSKRWLYLTFLSDSYGEFGGFHGRYEFIPESEFTSDVTVVTVASSTEKLVEKLSGEREKEREYVKTVKIYSKAELPKVASSRDRGSWKKGESIFARYKEPLSLAAAGVLVLAAVALLLIWNCKRRKRKDLSHLQSEMTSPLNPEPSGEVLRQELAITMSPFGRQHHVYESLEQPSLFAIPSVHNAIYQQNLEPAVTIDEPEPETAAGNVNSGGDEHV